MIHNSIEEVAAGLRMAANGLLSLEKDLQTLNTRLSCLEIENDRNNKFFDNLESLLKSRKEY